MKLHDLGVGTGTIILATVDLPNDMFWVDEHKWTPAVAKTTYSLTGALIIEGAAKLTGRPITLQPPSDMAWLPRTVVDTLRQWSATPNRRFKLVLEYPSDTRQFTVVFRHQDTPLEAEPVKGFPGHDSADWFKVTLRFTDVS